MMIYDQALGQPLTQPVPGTLKGHPFQTTVLEVSLKPFKRNDPAYIRAVATEMFTQWHSLLRHTDTVAVMLWTSDGSEILDYSGELTQRLEWARYIGNPNTEHEVDSGPDSLSLHERAVLYMEDPPEFTYGDLRFIVQTLKEVGQTVTGKPVIVGETFDPGPEFAKSAFKYEKHPEILGGNAMGHKTFVSCYSVLLEDQGHYAGYPDGIPDQTPFGTFFGRQSQHFLTDMGFDYLWFSNGFGFGAEGWSATGATFTGEEFLAERLPALTEKIKQFWTLFRQECPDFPIQTRGTNLSTGADLARDAVDLRAIYEGGFNLLPPPNSPWAALDGDFGLEMTGYMSRMAELPGDRFPFRYYTHDPWWLNSPWLDRYGREPHDIYLPMSVARIDAHGNVQGPTQLNFLSIDDSFGNMPSQVPDEVTPHILKARYDQPTAPGPVVWVYPFDEYHDWAYQAPDRLAEIYYGDWVIRQAINNGFPLNTVTSTKSFLSAIRQHPEFYRESILVGIVPDAGTPLASAYMDFVKNGGKLILYGPANHAGKAFMDFINLGPADEEIGGELTFESHFVADRLRVPYPQRIRHEALFSGGPINTAIKNRSDPHTRVLVSSNNEALAWTRQEPTWNGGKIAYLRGTNSSSFTGGRLLTPHDPTVYFPAPVWLRQVLQQFGWDILIDKDSPAVKAPVLTIARSNNAYFFSGYQPNSTVGYRMKTPQGAPLLLGLDTKLEDGYASYTLPTAWHRECRVFVDQQEGIVSYKVLHSGELGVTERYQVSGLENATVRIYPPDGMDNKHIYTYQDSQYPWRKNRIAFEESTGTELGRYIILKNFTGTLVVSW
ncbi:hypothetical protein [Parapedobacter sp. DT-150]|uniref:hypothetical protein n=1 Tax=Parapedobacter sp. DT-150 TaxID=3396162 RepID=UPI003F1AA534